MQFTDFQEFVPLALTDVVRVTDENIPKYRQANYEAMQAIIRERKILGSQALQRGEKKNLHSILSIHSILVSKLQNESHALQEQAELKIAREHWHNEQYKLNQQYEKYDYEHRTWLTDAFHDPDLLSLFHEITKYRIWLEENTIQFRKTTVLPLMQLKFVDNDEGNEIDVVNLFFREELQSNQITSENIADVVDALQMVKLDQNQLIHILDQEERQIEDELKECKNRKITFSIESYSID